MSSTNRPRIIPTKRSLLPPRLSSQSHINHSSKPADIQLRKPPFSALPTPSPPEKDNAQDFREGQREKSSSRTIECDFSKITQPFLEPSLWGRMQRQTQELAQEQEWRTSGDLEERERREREAEYGGLAIRGRTARRRRG